MAVQKQVLAGPQLVKAVHYSRATTSAVTRYRRAITSEDRAVTSYRRAIPSYGSAVTSYRIALSS